MIIDRRTLLGTTLAAGSTLALPRRSRAQSNTIKIGVLNDQSGPYRDLAGMHSVNACKLAIKEMGPGMTVEVVSADHQNKPDIGAEYRPAMDTISRQASTCHLRRANIPARSPWR